MTLAKLVSTTAFLVSLVGWTSLGAGLLASAFAMPLTVVLSKHYGNAQTEQAKSHEQRSTMLTDALLAIRQIKLSTLEDTWRRKIQQCRDKELQQLFKGALWMSSLVFVANTSSVVLAGVPIYVFALQGEQVSASVAFTSISLFRQLQADISLLPLISPPIWEAWLSLKRLEVFFGQNDLDMAQFTLSDTVLLDKASITWHGTGKNEWFTLKDLSMDFPEGELSIVTGKTGSGKSLLLTAIAGEARLVSGSIHRPCRFDGYKANTNDSWVATGQMALVSQLPWMANTTVRDNILFGLPFREDRYRSAIDSCALDKDFRMLEKGDFTMVGIKGVTLSGGQRWRIALARALYSRASLILLDDVLSAVDAEIRDWILNNALLGGLAQGRTRILVTHHESQCITRAAYHVHLCDGTAQVHLRPASRDAINEGTSQPLVNENSRFGGSLTATPTLNSAIRKDVDQGSSPTAECRESAIAHTPYRTYFDATGGTSSWLLVLLATATYEIVGLATSWWLREWASLGQSPYDTDHHSLSYGTFYLLMTTLSCLVTAARCFVWYKIGIKASETLFGMMTGTLFGAHLQWLEETSHGEIMTRFSSDMNTVDKRLPHDVGFLIECLTKLLSILFMRYVAPVFGPILANLDIARPSLFMKCPSAQPYYIRVSQLVCAVFRQQNVFKL